MEIYNKKRTYEISLWTLQDSFIAVLGDSSSQTRGYIKEPQMSLSNDGTLELDFSLPMYIDNGIVRKKNNIWEYMTDAVTIAGMRKIKVVFNKGTEVEKVYELIIVKVTDTHEQNMPMCAVHCEGLAFHELGKIGYKISLSIDEYLEEQSEALEQTDDENVSIDDQMDQGLINNIDYWCQKIGLIKYPDEINSTINASQWYYKIQMDWTGYERGSERATDKIYEESYISSYHDDLSAQTYNHFEEKRRNVIAERSNIYNLTQTIAQTFGVYCKYEYDHDDNYNITGRTVIFYNNFFDEYNRLEFTYPYTTNRITRENDCTDLVTKMYVNFTSSNQSDTGYVTITNNPVNPTGEDYLLNFDYLYAIGTITDEQYAYIREFSIAVKKINDDLIQVNNQQIKRETLDVTYRAELAVLNNAIKEDDKQLASYNELNDKLTDGSGKITRQGATRDLLFVSQNTITFNDKGIIANTIHLYESDIDNEISQPISIETDNLGYATSATIQNYNKNSVRAAYSYYPGLYYQEMIDTFTYRKQRDEAKYQALIEKQRALEDELENIEDDLESLLQEKEELLKEFERTMGPALREGNWTPEDYSHTPYSSYQFISSINTDISISNTIGKNDIGPDAALIWDSNLDYNEQGNSYTVMINEQSDTKYYYILLLNEDDLKEISTFYSREDNLNKTLSLVFWKNDWGTNNSRGYPTPVIKSFAFGSGCELVFCNDGSNITPALLLTDLTEEMLGTIMEDDGIIMALARIEVEDTELKLSNSYTKTVDQDGTETPVPYTIDKVDTDDDPTIISSEEHDVYQLRYRIKDYTLFTDDQNLKIKYGDTVLNKFEDYSVLEIIDMSQSDSDYGYNITFKPMSIIKLWNTDSTLQINYNCSQISTAIYLDAVQILKENAYPKVTYTIDPSIMYQDFFYTDYNALNRIAFINDHELEFNEVQGYISSVSLNLDKPWEDSIEVKNYKNKFEDIFSTIVAQTETMSKNEAIISSVGNVVSIGGTLSQTQLQSDLSAMTLKYSMTGGTLSIGKKEGILLNNNEGVVSLSSGGLIYASTSDDQGNWMWHSAITPRGINADAITYGTLNLVNVNLGNGALVTGDHSFILASANLELSSGSGITTTRTQSNINTGNIILSDGTLVANKISYDNGAEILTPCISLQDGILSISGAANLTIGGQSIQSYIESTVGSSSEDSSGQGWSWTIPIGRISVGRSNQNVYITDNSLRLGASNTVFSYSNSNNNNNTKISKLDLGSSFTYDTNSITKFNLNNILVYSSSEQTFLGWNLNTTDHSLTYTNNNTILSKISPTEFNLNNYLKIDSSGIAIKEPKFTKQTLNEHIITFINGQNETNYLLKITSEGLYYSLDAGANWYIVTSELVIPENNP